jgi:hypothetical protein
MVTNVWVRKDGLWQRRGLRPQTEERIVSGFCRISDMANIPELLNGHVTLEVECLDRLYLNGYIGGLATSGGLVTFMRVQLGKPIPSPVVNAGTGQPGDLSQSLRAI